MAAAEPAGGGRGVVLWSHARDLLRVFRPQVWVVLEDLALDAEWCDGRLVASSSARLVAEHLGIDPGTSAAALRALRDRGVAELCQTSGAAGRFGLAAYTLRLPSGVEVISPCVEQPHTLAPHTVEPDTDVAATDVAAAEVASAAAPPRGTGGRRAAPIGWSQDALDLGGGES